MVTNEAILEVLRTIPDPEMPISIVDLGLVEAIRVAQGENGDAVGVDILPTFVGCPALPMIEDDIRRTVAAIEGIGTVEVTFLFDPPWSVDRITPEGRAMLRQHGVTVPAPGASRSTGPDGASPVALRTSAIACPFCDSTSTRLDSSFGPTRCRMIYYCDACRNSFEHMKRVDAARPPDEDGR